MIDNSIIDDAKLLTKRQPCNSFVKIINKNTLFLM